MEHVTKLVRELDKLLNGDKIAKDSPSTLEQLVATVRRRKETAALDPRVNPWLPSVPGPLEEP